MLVFVYGTLLDHRIFARAAGSAAPLRRGLPAVLHGHRRVRLRGTPWPTLLAGQGSVTGRLLVLPRAALAGLAAWEGAAYLLATRRVATRRGPRRARVWIAPRWRAAPDAAWNISQPRDRRARM